MPTPTAIVQFLQQQPAPAPDMFGMKELLTIILSIGGTLLVTFLMRNWQGGDRDEDRIWKKIDEIEKALLRIELDVRDIKGYTEPIKEAIRLTVAGMVPRSNPLSDETNTAVFAWHHGEFDKLTPDILRSASRELVIEANNDPKLTEAEKLMFSVTAAAMNYEATKMETDVIRVEKGIKKEQEES